MLKNKGCIISLIVFAFLGIITFSIISWGLSKYNKMVDFDEQVKKQWGQVENTYQRRLDLLPNLERLVSNYAEHERETLKEVIEARSKATSTKIDANNLTPAMLQKFQANQSAFSSALSKLMVVFERYPNLKASQLYSNFQAQIEGTENRISTERNRFNEKASAYNSFIKKFPNKLIASFSGFNEKPYFESEKGAEKAPELFKKE